MAGSVNKVILIGNLGRDPEIRTMQSGDKVASFSLATSETWRDRTSGERRERTEWHRVAIFDNHLVDIAERYLRKGSKIYVEGTLQTRKWQDQSGQERVHHGSRAATVPQHADNARPRGRLRVPATGITAATTTGMQAPPAGPRRRRRPWARTWTTTSRSDEPPFPRPGPA